MTAQTKFRFAHHKLVAYRVAVDLADFVGDVVARTGPGHRRLLDQVERSAESTVALVAEGANRFTPGMKRQRYTEARGEAGETAAHIERMHRRGLLTDEQLLAGLALADRACALLTGLIRRYS